MTIIVTIVVLRASTSNLVRVASLPGAGFGVHPLLAQQQFGPRPHDVVDEVGL